MGYFHLFPLTKLLPITPSQWSVNQYLGTVKYRFILQISILYFFTGNIRISISMPSIKKYILIYWFFHYFSVSLWKHSKTFFSLYWNVKKIFLLCLSFKKAHKHTTSCFDVFVIAWYLNGMAMLACCCWFVVYRSSQCIKIPYPVVVMTPLH